LTDLDASHKAEINRITYEEFHRPIVLEKMKVYNNDVLLYFKREWDTYDYSKLVAPQKTSEDFGNYDLVETQFIKQFFSIKA